MHAVRLQSGEDLLLGLREFVKTHGIAFGVIVNGIGSASQYRVHAVKTTNMPPGDEVFGQAGPYDILNVNGFIIDGRVHAHVVLSDTVHATGGHLEEGTRVLTMAIVTVAETPAAAISDWDKF
jgi:predicted DNA-binding protein with PD1-like motif